MRFLPVVPLSLLLAACGGVKQDAAPAEVPQPEEQALTVPELDLSREAISATVDALTEDAPGAVGDAPAALPDLFDGDAGAEKRARVSGKVLTDEEAMTLRDRVDGVELKVEIPTN